MIFSLFRYILSKALMAHKTQSILIIKKFFIRHEKIEEQNRTNSYSLRYIVLHEKKNKKNVNLSSIQVNVNVNNFSAMCFLDPEFEVDVRYVKTAGICHGFRLLKLKTIVKNMQHLSCCSGRRFNFFYKIYCFFIGKKVVFVICVLKHFHIQFFGLVEFDSLFSVWLILIQSENFFLIYRLTVLFAQTVHNYVTFKIKKIYVCCKI